MTLAMLQGLVLSQANGWDHALDELGRYFELAFSRTHTPEQIDTNGRSLFDLANTDTPLIVRETVGGYLETAATLGKRTAELHLALADNTQDPAFAPEPFTAADLARLSAEMRDHAQKVLGALEENLGHLPDPVGDEARRVLHEQGRLMDRLGALAALDLTATKIRCHGNYHLGQVLWVENDVALLDFEGDPARPLAERRAKHSPLTDVASMLRSFSYAAYAGLLAFTVDRPEDFAPLESWAKLWQRSTSAAFLRAYRARAAGATFLPPNPARFQALLQIFILDRALYELHYDLNTRRDWVRIPLRGILSAFEEERLEGKVSS
jgi:maltose alpha-D-glucosyltransferase/alpha-amylase